MKSTRPERSAIENQKQIIILTTSSTEGDMCCLLQKCVRYFVQICESLKVRLIGVQLFVIYLETIVCFVFVSQLFVRYLETIICICFGNNVFGSVNWF